MMMAWCEWCLIVIRFTEKAIRAYAEGLEIHLFFIPPGLTDDLQSLNRFAFSAIKGTYCRL
jgi:hypothetical protein